MFAMFVHSFAQPALYLDPGSGSLLIQLLLAAALGIGVAVKMYWAKIQALFGKKKVDSTEDSAEKEKDEDEE